MFWKFGILCRTGAGAKNSRGERYTRRVAAEQCLDCPEDRFGGVDTCNSLNAQVNLRRLDSVCDGIIRVEYCLKVRILEIRWQHDLWISGSILQNRAESIMGESLR